MHISVLLRDLLRSNFGISSGNGLNLLNPKLKMFSIVDLVRLISFPNRFDELKPKLWPEEKSGFWNFKPVYLRQTPINLVRIKNLYTNSTTRNIFCLWTDSFKSLIKKLLICFASKIVILLQWRRTQSILFCKGG